MLERASTEWFPMSPINRLEYVNMLFRSSVKMADQVFQIAGINDEFEEGWREIRQPNRELPYKNEWWNAVTIEVSLD